MPIDAAGLLDSAQFIASPNCDERPAGTEISLLVIHNISLPPDEFGGDGVIELFTNQIDPQAHPYYQTLQGLKVSAHFFIRRDGTIIQFVPCMQRAWHAGVSQWQGRERCNDFSIGIELEGSDTTPFTDAQYTALAALTQCLCDHYPVKDIAGHSDIAPGRKTDPGPCFDWRRYTADVNRGDLFLAARHISIGHEKL
ncbi:1,6-anhydro-N-acetylmuramyl-L-alanine amidase AmpD [Nitrosomonas sp. Is35]|uniref:1,6-anhydro-N-acetylmuramyl-L-alanine amidase AmpD n=1 Tax=Nitrosomonas sp. Is35 TaxID=3080534 RepID=UPI00294B1388|nr:1,6-anhydro-N-acetylmuramyl-L-alanine amidase AmpD [Nitrosomonas sp. Is35]MDV6346797.1 1,6-anhydro-N-acetylmuramyl-L-alanine amidase AmpD [Nitrosomonas sp. Is35]